MDEKSYLAVVVEEESDGRFTRHVRERSLSDLAGAEVIVRVAYSSINYKDVLSATGHRGITRQYPHTPGIDAVGKVFASKSTAFSPGDQVIVTGHDLGMNTNGAWSQYIAAPATWIMPMPQGLSAWECMALGTAGFTAAMCVRRLEETGLSPPAGDIVVTGATGGVGCLTISLMNQLGYRVVALTRKSKLGAFLRKIGATEIVDRTDFMSQVQRPLLTARWAGAVDTVGGPVLDAVLRSIKYGGAVACCGMAASPQLDTNVYPFILRDVSLLGIDSSGCEMSLRCQLWSKLANEWKIRNLSAIATEIGFDNLDETIEDMLAGQHHGRKLVRINHD